MSIIGCHFILIVSCTFKFSSMTLSLSLSHVHWILCYRIKNIGVCVSVDRVLLVYLAGFLTIDFTINIPLVVYLAYGSTANF